MKKFDNKNYTSLEQSKVLAEILPVESADMRYGYIAPYDYSDSMYDGGYDEIPYPKDIFIKNPNFSADEYDAEFPCWSLAALLEVIRNNGRYELQMWEGGYSFEANGFMTEPYFNPIDTCCEMIINLHERELL